MSIIKSQSPGVFIGTHELATVDNIYELADSIEQFVTGPNHEPSQSGYVPWIYKADGTLDIDTLFPELVSSYMTNTGINVSKDGTNVASGVKNISFNGEYITMSVDETGQLNINIDKPKDGIPRFNSETEEGSSKVEIITPLTDMILSETQMSVFGDWEPGQIYKGISHVVDSNSITSIRFKTNDKMFAKTNEGYFQIIIYDYEGNPIAGESFTTINVSGNTHPNTKLPSRYTNDSPNIFVYISNFTEEINGFTFIPEFKINISNIYLNDSDDFRSGRFSVKICFIEDGEVSIYKSPDLLYNDGKLPFIPLGNENISINTTSDVSNFKWCSGIKYLTKGEVEVTLSNVENLNYVAAIENKFDYQISGLNTSGEFVSNNYSLDMNDKSSWKLSIPIASEKVNNTKIDGYVIAKNGCGSSLPHDISISLLTDTRSSYRRSTDLVEYFNDESKRTLNDFSNEEWDSSANIMEYDHRKALMVIPGKGLMYPYGNWSSFLPIGSPDYSLASTELTDRYFSRKFVSHNLKTKFGGIFIVEGKKIDTERCPFDVDDFKSDKITMIFSNDNGLTWYNLKEIRNSSKSILINNRTPIITHGVLFDVKMVGRRLFIYWSYPKHTSSVNNIWFKFGMSYDAKYCIRSIQLLANDGSEEW